MDEWLTKVIKFIGSVVFAASIYAPQILLTCAIMFSWIPIIKIVLLLANVCIFAVICAVVFVEVDD